MDCHKYYDAPKPSYIKAIKEEDTPKKWADLIINNKKNIAYQRRFIIFFLNSYLKEKRLKILF